MSVASPASATRCMATRSSSSAMPRTRSTAMLTCVPDKASTAAQ